MFGQGFSTLSFDKIDFVSELQNSDMEIGDAKNAVLVIAFHHNSGNIASLRFRGLLRYLPRDKYSVRVITTGKKNTEILQENGEEVIEIGGSLISEASFWTRLLVFTQAVLGLPFVNSSWIARVVNEGKGLVGFEKSQGKNVVVLGTYSPIDALIAARFIADSERVPLILDFRDGFAFESLGRKGWLFAFLRKRIEAWVVRSADLVLSVSNPLVMYFQKRYKTKCVSLLYNGFDDAMQPIKQLAIDGSNLVEFGPLHIGHFGRMSASDASSFDTLARLQKYLSRGKPSFPFVFEFYGGLTAEEKRVLSSVEFKAVLHGEVHRDVVHSNMQRMSALLLVTGNRTSVATGKIFEYLASGRRILLVTQCRNEAARIIENIGDDDLVIDFSNQSSVLDIAEIESRLSRPFTRNFDRVRQFAKSRQALHLASLLDKVLSNPAHESLLDGEEKRTIMSSHQYFDISKSSSEGERE